ncbi:hypothetical protein DLAC_07684, partial [Tieghemostelium lacteum]
KSQKIFVPILVEASNEYRSCANINGKCDINTDDIVLECIYDSACKDGICIDRNTQVAGKDCQENNECQQGLVCNQLDEICQNNNFVQHGYNCNTTEQCIEGLFCQLSTCLGKDFSDSCSQNYQCPPRSYCNRHGECETYTIRYAECTYSEECGISGMCWGQTCSNKYAIPESKFCGGFSDKYKRVACNPGSNNVTCTWNENIGDHQCLSYSKTNGTCGPDSDITCQQYIEYCDFDSKSCKPIYKFTAECKNAESAKDFCLEDNNCVPFSDYPTFYYNETCAMLYCDEEICNHFSQCYQDDYPCAPIPQYCVRYQILPHLSAILDDSYFIHDSTKWPKYATIIVVVAGAAITAIIIISLIIRYKKLKNKFKNNNNNNIKIFKSNNNNIEMTTPSYSTKESPINYESHLYSKNNNIININNNNNLEKDRNSNSSSSSSSSFDQEPSNNTTTQNITTTTNLYNNFNNNNDVENITVTPYVPHAQPVTHYQAQEPSVPPYVENKYENFYI